MEIWDVLDREGRKTGKTIERGRGRLSRGEYHLVVHIWIINDEDMFLLQKRSDDRPLMPGEWAATGGSALAGESSISAAIRELHEELGILAKEDEMVLLGRMVRRNSINDIWALRRNVAMPDLTLQTEEVARVKWVTPARLRAMVSRGEFHNYSKDYFETVFTIFERLGKPELQL